MKKIWIIVLAVVLVIAVGVEVFLFANLRGGLSGLLSFGGKSEEGQTAEEQTDSQQTAEAQAPEEAPPAAVSGTDVPAPTQAPATATPVPTPEPATPTPAPTPEPTPTAVPSSSGSCASSTGTALNMNVDWRTEALGNGTTRVYVTGRITSYSLDVGPTSVTVTLGDQSVSCSVGSMKIGDGVLTDSDLFNTSLDVPTGSAGTLTVDWFFNGSYSGVSLPHVTAACSVTG